MNCRVTGNALAKLLNSLSWHPRITLPKPIDPQGIVLRIDLRDSMWDANLWNRLVADYPYGILTDTAVARAVLVATGTRLPYVRLDWFVANASRAPLYYDLLQTADESQRTGTPARVDVTADIQQSALRAPAFSGAVSHVTTGCLNAMIRSTERTGALMILKRFRKI